MTAGDADHWLVRLLFGISRDPAQRARDMIKVYIGLILSVLLAGLFCHMTLQGPRLGLPDRTALIEAQGTIRGAEEFKGTVYFSLAELPDKFDYQSKAGDGKSVFDALTPGARVTAWHEPRSTDYRVGEDRLTVYQIEVGGQMVRSYDEVEAAWVSNNGLSPWLAAVFGLSIAYFVAYIWLVHRT